jgi:TonB-linked SusC/RagA family outer membrane protein
MKRILQYTIDIAVVPWMLFAMLLLWQPATAQQRSLSGQVTNAQHEPIPGVSIYQRGTTHGTMSDAEGRYTLNVADSAIVVFSTIGYLREEIAIKAQRVINVTLTEDIIGLEEVVVVGYGEQKRSNVSGAVASVEVAAMQNKTQLRLDQALQGMVAGVTVARNGGAPGDKPSIHIRGVGSISNTDPLWIVDGVRMDPGNQFDVDDVESIEILKDAAASAIYGAKAAHGVILVTTKRGKGALQVVAKSSVSKRQAINLPTLLGSADFVKYAKVARINAGRTPDESWDSYNADTDWINEFYNGSGVLQSYDLAISKGDDNSSFYLSFGHDSEKGILIDNSFKRYSIRLNSDLKLMPWLTLGESMLLSRVEENPISNFDENYNGGIPYRSIPIMPVRDPENQWGGWGRAPVYFQGPNPVATQYQQHEQRKSNRVDGNLYLDARPLKGLQIRAALGINYFGYLAEKFDEAFSYGSFSNTLASLTYGTASDLTLTGNVVATYDKSFGRHNVKLMGGYEAYKYDGQHFNALGTNFPVDVARSLNLTGGAINITDRQTIARARQLSQFGRVSYNYDDRYLLEVNVRRDASAPKFGPTNIWGVFPSVSAGWRISQERFFQNVPFITNLKLRGSVGKLGSDNIDSFIYLKTYTSQFSSYAFDEEGKNKVVGYYISRLPNKDVKWEEVNMKNIAIDLRAFANRFSLSVDYYIKDTKDLLYGVPVPPSVGIATHNFDPVNPAINIGTMRNTGVDIDLGYTHPIQKFALSLNGNVSFMKNEMKSLRGDEYITGGSAGLQMGGMTRTQAGHPISSFYGYVVRQMLNSAADVYAINTYADDGLYQEAGTGPGDFMYKDISGPNGKPDGEVTAEYDRVFIGNPWPKMTYAFNIGVSYNRLVDLSLQFQGVQGVDIFNASKAYTRNFFGDSNTTTDIYEAWTPEHQTGNPRNIASDPNGNFSRPSSYFVEDGSYLKLRNVQLGFNVPVQMLTRLKLRKVRAYVNANNLLTFTRYSGMDPEVAGSNLGRGVDYGRYPMVRTYGGGLEVQF